MHGWAALFSLWGVPHAWLMFRFISLTDSCSAVRTGAGLWRRIPLPLRRVSIFFFPDKHKPHRATKYFVIYLYPLSSRPAVYNYFLIAPSSVCVDCFVVNLPHSKKKKRKSIEHLHDMNGQMINEYRFPSTNSFSIVYARTACWADLQTLTEGFVHGSTTKKINIT